MTSTDPDLPVAVALASPAPPVDDVEASLYKKRRKICPREVHGWFATVRVSGAVMLLGLFYGVCWLRWDERQLLLFDLPARRFNVFWWTFYPQDFLYLALLLILAALLAVFAGLLALRIPAELDIIGDRNALWRETDGGLIRNVYTLKIVNMHDEPLRWRVGVSGIEGLSFDADYPDREVAPGEVASIPVRLDAPREALRSESTPVRFTVEAIDAVDIRASEETRFLGPAPGR